MIRRTLIRRIVNLLAGASLVLAVLLATMWVRSYFFAAHASWASQGVSHNHYRYTSTDLRISHGSMMVTRFIIGVDLSDTDHAPAEDGANVPDVRGTGLPLGFAWRGRERPANFARGGWRWRAAGFAWAYDHGELVAGAPMGTLNVLVPLWAMVGLTVLPPAAWAYRVLGGRRGRSGVGSCAACGYDLRATPDRCPECGAATGASAAAPRRSGGPRNGR